MIPMTRRTVFRWMTAVLAVVATGVAAPVVAAVPGSAAPDMGHAAARLDVLEGSVVSGEGDIGPYRAGQAPAEQPPEGKDSGGYVSSYGNGYASNYGYGGSGSGSDESGRSDSGPYNVGQWWGRDPLPPPPMWGGPGWGSGWGWGPGWWGGPGWGGNFGWWDGRFHGGFSAGWRGPGWSGGFRWHR